MAKRILGTVLDQALTYIKNNATRLVVCSSEPTTYTEGNATYNLASITISSTDLTVAAGDGAGNSPRKVTEASKTGSVSTSGTGTHVALLDVTNSALLFVTTCTSQALTSGNSLTVGAFKLEMGAPT